MKTSRFHSFRPAGFSPLTLAAALVAMPAAGMTAGAAGPVSVFAPASAAAVSLLVADETEDVLVMRDGRVLRGRVLEEGRDSVLFELAVEGIRSQVRYARADIDAIRRNVPVEKKDEAVPDRTDPGTGGRTERTPEAQTRRQRSFGARRVTRDDDVTRLYLIPMRGQFGTDVSYEPYAAMIEDIRTHDPDYLVFTINSADVAAEEPLDDLLTWARSRMGERSPDRSFDGSGALDMYRKIINIFRDELRDYPQIVWVHDSVGISSVLSLSWTDIYMKPTARFGGLGTSARNFMVVAHDQNMLGKYREAYVAWLKGFVEHSEHDLRLVDAMVRPEYRLSATWQGRAVKWALDASGEYIVDNSDSATVNFTARTAENFRISDGTAEDLDDLALLLGIREYRVVDGKAEQIIDRHITDWRRAFDRSVASLREVQKIQQFGTGGDQLQDLGRIRQELQKVLSAMKRYDAVDLRMQAEYGINTLFLEVMIEQIGEQIRALSQNRGGAGRGGRGGAGGMGTGG